MTDLPQLLSPLFESIIDITIKEMRARYSIPGLAHLDDAESFDMSLNESNNVKVDRKLSRGNVLSRKEQSTDASTMEELVSNTMKLPFLSSLYSFSDDLVRADDGPCDSLKETHKVMVREKIFSSQKRNNVLERKYMFFNVGDEEGLPSVIVKIINCGEHNEGGNSFDL
ncbi:hypothetical protein V8G54_024154 [Vigna mungo]|uniref:Uncharacterized protein n=1 Tax=Vigna mungo TaxID=3915 RepID=A0AAQ3RS99_VIGMU